MLRIVSAACRMNPSRVLPQRPKSHAVGDKAVEIVIAACDPAWVIAPVNKDYGLDLRIEVTRGGYVTGEEFAVQVNGQASVRVKGDLPPLANVRQATVNYWLGKLTPTMITAGKPRLIPGRIAARSGSKPDRS